MHFLFVLLVFGKRLQTFLMARVFYWCVLMVGKWTAWIECLLDRDRLW